jgi:pyruvate dehydrogenase E2 component (dihydrolipoamide acetyltransferase)
MNDKNNQSKRVKITRMRKLIANRLRKSFLSTVPVTMTTEVDVSQLVLIRNQAKSKNGLINPPSYNAILMKAVSINLLNHTHLNCTWDSEELVYWKIINVGIAIDTPRGLLVPVIRDVQEKSITELSFEIKSLAEDAMRGKILPDQFHGGTFTITNLGMYDVDLFTPIINYPQVAILGIGQIRKTFNNYLGSNKESQKMFLNLTIDHCAVDGAPAAKFLSDLKVLVENPKNWLQLDD